MSTNESNEKNDRYSKKYVESFLKELGDEDLLGHFEFNVPETLNVFSVEDAKRLLNEPKHIIHKKGTEGLFVFDGDEGEETLLPNRWTTSFSDSDQWVSDKLYKYLTVFPNSSTGYITLEQECFYISLCIAGVFQNSYKTRFIEVLENYNFEKWTGVEDIFGEVQNWESLYNEWFNTPSKEMKMIISACKYAISVQKNDAWTFRTSGLPEEEVLGLENLRSDIKNLRSGYERNQLSEIEKSKRTKLENKLVFAEQEKEVEALVINSEFKELWRLFKISTNYIPTKVSGKIYTTCRKQIIADHSANKFGENVTASDLVQERSKLVKLTRKAWVSRFKKEQVALYLKSPKDYKAPLPS